MWEEREDRRGRKNRNKRDIMKIEEEMREGRRKGEKEHGYKKSNYEKDQEIWNKWKGWNKRRGGS